ncbi:MAG: EamA family transporter RarD [Caulobacterales bacterium]
MNETQETQRGIAAAAAAYALWGVLPAFLKLLSFAPPGEVLASRILWSAPWAALAVALTGGFSAGWREVAQKGVVRALLLSAVFIAVNWWVYVWAVANGHVIEASLAYFLTPLVNVAFGVTLFGERLGRVQIAALTLAGLGVLVQAIALGAPPWIALSLCATWSLYGLVRKKAPVSAGAGLLVETLALSLPAAGALIFMAGAHPLAATSGPMEFTLLALTGPVTAIPLILFAIGARRVPFSMLGLLQYIAPSLQFLLGVAFGEPLTPLRLVSFALIWGGLALFSFDALRAAREKRA